VTDAKSEPNFDPTDERDLQQRLLAQQFPILTDR
jgi:hypothetical protein